MDATPRSVAHILRNRQYKTLERTVLRRPVLFSGVDGGLDCRLSELDSEYHRFSKTAASTYPHESSYAALDAMQKINQERVRLESAAALSQKHAVALKDAFAALGFARQDVDVQHGEGICGVVTFYFREVPGRGGPLVQAVADVDLCSGKPMMCYYEISAQRFPSWRDGLAKKENTFYERREDYGAFHLGPATRSTMIPASLVTGGLFYAVTGLLGFDMPVSIALGAAGACAGAAIGQYVHDYAKPYSRYRPLAVGRRAVLRAIRSRDDILQK